eukprot:3961654-Amphidinium_carterae.1
MEIHLTPAQVDLTAIAEASKPPTPRNPTGPGSYLGSTTLTVTRLVSQTEQHYREAGNETTRINRQQERHRREEDEMREQFERALHSLEPQIQQHLEKGYARRWRVLEADAEREYNRAKQ